ncbi:MAG: Holliday junction resolvase RuvX [Planctomycetota bacterium]|nr:Holliday junction resolvase RuvX [Planctomycetota bacterium]
MPIDGGPAAGYNGLMRVLGLDLGKRRVGVAVSDPDGTIARPLVQFRVAGRGQIVETVQRLVAEQGAARVVVGLPLLLDGTPGEQVRWTEGVARALAGAIDVPVETWDERFSTDEADAIMDRSGQRGRDRKGRRDMVAAAVILQSYLDARQG